jgi:hypothetical protein
LCTLFTHRNGEKSLKIKYLSKLHCLTLPIETSSFTISELKAATKNLKSSKAFGPDNIPAVIWKDENFHELLLCNYTLSMFKSPKIWHQSQIIPMPKKGDLSLVTYYRGISLMAIAAKN